ncbi:MAG: aldehyde dehydrogenase family protein, partial [Burkholderiales bacterium]
MGAVELITGGRAAELPATPIQRRMLVCGAWVDAVDGARVKRASPAHGVTVASYPAAGQADAGRAVDAARAAFDRGPWP